MPRAAVTVQVGDLLLPLRRSAKRRSIGIKVAGGVATVAAPVAAPISEIQIFLTGKLSWIKKHLARQRESLQQQATPQQTFLPGATIGFLGRQLTVNVVATTPIAGHILTDTIQLHLPEHLHKPSAIRQLIKHIYAREAYAYIAEKIDFYGPQLGVKPKAVQIKEYKSRWGSCNTRRELQFNWLLMLAPHDAVNYVIVHELCHLVHFNHSPKFWSLVRQLIPNYQMWRKWFRDHGAILNL